MSLSASMFDRIETEPVSDLVIHQIENMIVQGILSEGDRLPSERELSARLNVSRPKLRDALKFLEEEGLIVVRHGEGTFVAKLTGNAMEPALINLYAKNGQAFFDYLEYRRAQEAFASRLAAERATPTDRKRIEQTLEELERAEDEEDSDASREADVLFHSTIVEASHNAMLIHMMKSIYELTRRGVFYNRKYLRMMDGSGAKLLEQHQDIARAVLDGDSRQAKVAAIRHMDFVEKSFRLGLRQQQSEIISQKRAASK